MPATIIDMTAQSENEDQAANPSEANTTPFQDIRKQNIDAGKLVALLRGRFGVNGYKIYTIHSVYSIRAPEQLSEEDIELCK
ncbi:hypothetical protein F5Y14DRAFT_434098 [Nemania sp. NC0429]|nr:hypothetical protein F5Y14DRAFT_434098 [Nemania sp. NC0429]